MSFYPIRKSALALTYVALSATAHAQSTSAIKPAGEWRVGIDHNNCLAMRDYGSQNKRSLTLRLQTTNRNFTLGYVNLFLADIDESLRLAKSWNGVGAGAITASGGLHVTGDYVRRTSFTFRGPETAIEIRPPDLSAMAAASSISITADGSTVSFSNPSLANVRTALEQCRRDLWKRFDLDGVAVLAAATAAKPLTPSGELIGIQDYPVEMQKKKQRGPVGVLWAIDTTGRATDCKVIIPSPYDELNQLTCDLIVERARYAPALDRLGSPVPAWDTTTVFWITTTINGRIPVPPRRRSLPK